MKQKLSIIARAVGVLGALVLSVGGATYALTSNSVTLTNSSITTGTAGLKIYNFSTNQWATSAPGFTITDLIPGTPDEEQFYLQNDGDASLNIFAHVPNLPGPPANSNASNGGYGFVGFENVKITITGQACDDPAVETDLLELNQGNVELPCNPLNEGDAGDSNAPGHVGNYDITFDINESAVDGESAGVGNFDIVFTGTTPPPATTTTENQ